MESFIRIGREAPEFKHADYRQVWLKPCWVYYRIDGQNVVILHVRRSEKLLRVDDLFIGD